MWIKQEEVTVYYCSFCDFVRCLEKDKIENGFMYTPVTVFSLNQENSNFTLQLLPILMFFSIYQTDSTVPDPQN